MLPGPLLGLVVIAAATAARLIGGSTWLQLSCAAVVGAGIAIAQTLLPAVVKSRFADRAGLATGVYTTGLGAGGAVAAGVSAPLADFLGSWPGALASWSVLALAGAVAWTASRRSLALDEVAAPAGPLTTGLPWRSGLAWRVTALSAVNSALYYCELAWVVPLLQENGRGTGAGGLLTVMISIQVVAMLAVPALLGERRDIRVGLASTAALTSLGFAGLALAPGTATWLWILALGVGHGGLFTLVLTVPVVVSRHSAEAGRISAMAFFVGYGCAALAPMLVGLLRDATGDFRLAFALLAASAVLTLVPILRLRKAARS
ncbi:MFS transporter [Actinomadura rupiterrae]|uniref:MFS transporter n=1 Tax=Actinomadura rupiterrae TaxID=559627 RepID=UPI0020A25B89|nr:MFS transporter [Actinomadura rupiterrae]MCP2343126.1 CP family cyanate transporter-like MFS transporter [Actinomadura rupiterrae]